MPNLRKVSGEKLLKVLCNKFGFSVLRQQRGSHVSIAKETSSGKIGTLKAVLKQAGISEEEIIEFL